MDHKSALQNGGYLAGTRLSAADIYLLMFAVWMEESIALLLGRHPVIGRLTNELKNRSYVDGILERHKNEEWSD